MKAYLMSAGMATRLRPITENVAKCMLPIAGSPIIEHWLDAIRYTGEFEKVYVNVHHCADAVEAWIKRYRKLHPDLEIEIIDERSRLLGTAGTLFWHGDTTDDFMLVYTDTYSGAFMRDMKMAVRNWKDNPDPPVAGLVTFHLPEDKSAGAINVDNMGNVESFEEKSGNGLVAWAGIMLGSKKFFNEIRQEDKDLARDVFPRLIGKIRVLQHVDAYDMGRTVSDYENADRKIFKTKRH
jgi:mannose-1-phosphate guanylyltransferase